MRAQLRVCSNTQRSCMRYGPSWASTAKMKTDAYIVDQEAEASVNHLDSSAAIHADKW